MNVVKDDKKGKNAEIEISSVSYPFENLYKTKNNKGDL